MAEAYIGIDPGNKGAICLLSGDLTTIDFIDNSKPINHMVDWLEIHKNNYFIKKVLIEDVHSIFGTSAKSNFSFGFNTGVLHGVIKALQLPLDTVNPKIWQKSFGIKSKGKLIKKEVATICNTLYVNPSIYGSKGGLLDGRSDALGIATYCYHKYK